MIISLRDNFLLHIPIGHTIALAEKISALTTETYLQERASKGRRNKFEDALNLVPDVDPDDEDKL